MLETGKERTLTAASGDINCKATVEISLEVSPKLETKVP